MNSGKTIVVKIGGSTLGSHDTTLQDLVTVQKEGLSPVVVHGGGNRITEWLKRMGITSTFIRGMRATDEETLGVVIAVLAGLVNKELVAGITSQGGKAIGLSGVDGALIQAKVTSQDLGYVGEVVNVDPGPINVILNAGYMPVIAPAGIRSSGGSNTDPVKVLNINADVSASRIATAIKADRLIFLTDVPGVQDSEGKILAELSPEQAGSLITSGVISGGMIPKVEGCIHALSSVASTQIVDGRSEGALLKAIKGNKYGTTIDRGYS